MSRTYQLSDDRTPEMDQTNQQYNIDNHDGSGNKTTVKFYELYCD